MIRSGFCTVPFAGELPSLGPDIDIEKISSKRFVLSHQDDFAVLTFLGMAADNAVCFVVTSNGKAFAKLVTNLGSSVYTIAQVLTTPTLRTWLKNNTDLRAIRRNSDNAIVGIHPPNVIAGQYPIQLGLANDTDPDETYAIVSLI